MRLKQRNNETARVLIKGLENINRAIDGDDVIIELLDESEWSNPSNEIHLNEEVSRDETIKIEVNSNNVESKNKMITGKVVGIKKKNSRKYCCTPEATQNRGSFVNRK